MNKKTFLVTAILGLILVGGAGFGFYSWKMNANSFKGISVPVNGLREDLKDELSQKWEAAFQEVLSDEVVLKEIVEETEYAAKMGVPSDEAVSHLKDAVKVRYRKRKDAIEVGLVGKRKQDDDLAKIADFIYKRAAKEVVLKEPSFQQYLDLAGKAREEAKAGGKAPPSE